MSRYTDLVTSEHADKPKFIAALLAITEPLDQEQVLLRELPADFDLDSAAGAQLDAVGLWVGVGRFVKTPLTGIYFSWDTPGIGWDEGYWKRQFDPTQGLTALPDSAYRLLIKATIALNYWDGSVQVAQDAIAPLFPNNFVSVEDNFDMSMTVVVSGPVLDVLSAALLTGGYLALKPSAVRINYVFSSAPPAPVFAWDVDNAYLGGWDTGAWGQDTPPT